MDNDDDGVFVCDNVFEEDPNIRWAILCKLIDKGWWGVLGSVTEENELLEVPQYTKIATEAEISPTDFSTQHLAQSLSTSSLFRLIYNLNVQSYLLAPYNVTHQCRFLATMPVQSKQKLSYLLHFARDYYTSSPVPIGLWLEYTKHLSSCAHCRSFVSSLSTEPVIYDHLYDLQFQLSNELKILNWAKHRLLYPHQYALQPSVCQNHLLSGEKSSILLQTCMNSWIIPYLDPQEWSNTCLWNPTSTNTKVFLYNEHKADSLPACFSYTSFPTTQDRPIWYFHFQVPFARVFGQANHQNALTGIVLVQAADSCKECLHLLTQCKDTEFLQHYFPSIGHRIGQPLTNTDDHSTKEHLRDGHHTSFYVHFDQFNDEEQCLDCILLQMFEQSQVNLI